MQQTNNLINNSLSSSIHKNSVNKFSWCDIRNVASKQELVQQYVDICQKHDLENKWVLMINPDESPLQQLSIEGKIDPKKILKVNISRKDISLHTIEHALEKGHCSAVILCNAILESIQISQLTHYAKKGQTKCIILKKETQTNISQPSTKNLITSHLSAQLH